MKQAGRMPPLSDTLQFLLPDGEETQILRSCIMEGRDAAAGWLSWKATRPDLERALSDEGTRLRPLLPLLHFNLTRSNVAIDDSALVVLRAASIWEERRLARIRLILAGMLEALRRESIRPVLMNGLAAAETVYPQSSLRHCHDVDLLIAPDELGRAVAILGRCEISPLKQARGMRRMVAMAHADGLPINLHLSPFARPLPASLELEMRARAPPLSVMGQSVSVLSPPDLLLHLAGWFPEGGLTELAWVTDAAGLLKGFDQRGVDGDRLVRDAEAARLSLPLLVMLHYLSTKVSVRTEESILHRLAAMARRSSTASRDALLADVIKARPKIGLMLRESGWRSRSEIIRFLAAPSPEFVGLWCADHGVRWWPSGYLRRPWRKLAESLSSLRDRKRARRRSRRR